MRKSLQLMLAVAVLLWACKSNAGDASGAEDVEAGVVTAHSRGLHGYIGFSASRPPERSAYSAGMGFYSAVWPLIAEPIAGFQIGLPSA